MSTDGTAEIAQRLADVYIRDVHHGHAEPSRALAASRSSGDWILILDADERMSDLLKSEIRSLIEGDADGYWIRKVNYVGGVEESTVLHYRLVRKSRTRFDPRPHGGATAVSDNVENFDLIGIIHEKTVEEQIFDDARYEQMALEDDAPTSAKRNWLSHNRTLREQRSRERRSDLEQLVPADATHVLIVGDIPVELPDCTVARDDAAEGTGFDAAIVALVEGDPLAAIQRVAGRVRPGGWVIGTAPAARNRRRIEQFISTALTDGGRTDVGPAGALTRRALLDALEGAGLDPRWT